MQGPRGAPCELLVILTASWRGGPDAFYNVVVLPVESCEWLGQVVGRVEELSDGSSVQSSK